MADYTAAQAAAYLGVTERAANIVLPGFCETTTVDGVSTWDTDDVAAFALAHPEAALLAARTDFFLD